MLFAFIDKARGLSFVGKRQTCDYTLMIDMIDSIKSLGCDEYSIGKLRAVCVNQGRMDLMDRLRLGKLNIRKNIFIELQNEEVILKLLSKQKEVTLYMWDKEYPSTIKFPELTNWILVSQEKITGLTHTATKFVYRRK